MNRIILILSFLVLLIDFSFAQNRFSANIIDEHSKEPLTGVNIFLQNTQIGAASDENGFAEIKNIPNGKFIVKFSAIGFEEVKLTVNFPEDNGRAFEIFMESEAEEFEEISVTSTRGSRTIQNEPTRVEVIAGEEVDEKISMDPSNISLLLSESTGIQVQQTSAASANASFRIQGLDGKYTLLLKDGFPLYGGFSGSLSLVQVPPLDLSQVEIIKGSSSTLYGGGAIAGLINLVTKDPTPKREISFLLNGTSAKGLDASGFYSQRFENYGITLLASRNIQAAYDNNDDKFSDIPEIKRFSINPKFHFYFSEKSKLELGASFTDEERLGGSIDFIDQNEDSLQNYFEKNNSGRFSTQARYNLTFGDKSEIEIKNSVGYFERKINLPDYDFDGEQISSFTEALYKMGDENSEWIFGLNLWSEKFSDKARDTLKRNYNDITFGGFVQNTFDAIENISVESGLRTDYNKDYGTFVLPRVSLLVKWSEKLSSRIGGGLGYKIPNIFTEEAEQLSFRSILPIDKDKLEAERSYGFNFDINYNTIIFENITLSFNNLFFYTQINDPVILSNNQNNLFEFSTLNGNYNSRGIETNMKLTYEHFKLFTGYTFINTKSENNEAISELPLTPKHKLGFVLMYEEHDNLRIGFEGYYTGIQKLSTGEKVDDYWVNGFMIEKYFENFSLFINFENFFDTRQSKFGPMFTGTPQNPVFAEIYAPTDGRVINGGIKIKL